jgi:hypothetical protein
MKATELIGKVQKYARDHEISALAACKKLKIGPSRYYAAVAREAKREGKAGKRAGATAKPARRARVAVAKAVEPTPAAGTWRVTCVPTSFNGDVAEAPYGAMFLGTAAQVASLVRALE